MRRRRGRPGMSIGGAVALLVVAAMATGAGAEEQGEPDLEGWRGQLDRAEELLAKGGERRAARTLEMCDQLHQDMLEWPGRGSTAARLLAEAMRCLAVAEARSGETAKAGWHWAQAQNLSPDLAEGGLAAYPDVAATLGQHRVTADALPAAGSDGYVPPSPLGMAPIAYPGRIRQQAIEGTTEVAVVVDESGFPALPVLRTSCGVPGFDLAVMEAARQWSFSPATQDGRPVRGTYVLQARLHLGS